MRTSYLISKLWYYTVVAGVFILLSAVFLLLGKSAIMSPDWAINLASECWGIAATVLFLMFLLDLREYRQWTPVRDEVMKTIGTAMGSLFKIFSDMCECTQTPGKSREESGEEFRKRLLLIQLEELEEKVELNEPGKKYFSTTDFVDLYSGQARFLGDIETKYSRFLDAPLRLSLMKIQDALVNLGLFLSIRKDSNVELFFGSHEKFLKSISVEIHKIMKQIHEIHKSGIEIYPV